MFKKEESIQEIETVIGPSVHVEGDFVAAGNVVVEGAVTGNLKTDKYLRVGNNAKITANVSAGNALVSGEIHGNISVKEGLELTASAKIFGDIKTKTISVASGAVLNGKCLVGDENISKHDDKMIKSMKSKDARAYEDSAKTRAL